MQICFMSVENLVTFLFANNEFYSSPCYSCIGIVSSKKKQHNAHCML